MKAIKTKYHGPGNVKGSRISATDEDGNRVVLSYRDELNSEQNHRRAAKQLCEKMKWRGTYYGGHLRDCMVWVDINGCRDAFSFFSQVYVETKKEVDA